MLEGLLWMIGIYGSAILAVHIGHLRFQAGKQTKDRKHYIFILGDKQLQIEWFLRSLILWNKMLARDIRFTIVAQHTDSETLAIASRLLEQSGCSYRMVHRESELFSVNSGPEETQEFRLKPFENLDDWALFR